MKKEIKKKWVAALRSGKYKQVKNALHVEKKGFCCLGVLTDIYMKEKGIEEGWRVSGKSFVTGACEFKLTKKGEYETCAVLPEKVSRWAGLKGISDPLVQNTRLSQHNDGVEMVSKKTFKQIADLIQDEL